jgi:hypothetical protein
VEGGAVVPLGDIANFDGVSWGEDGGIVVSQPLKGLLRIPFGGGPPQTVAGLGNGELALALPQILPGSKAILLAAARSLNIDDLTIEVLKINCRSTLDVHAGLQEKAAESSSGGYRKCAT